MGLFSNLMGSLEFQAEERARERELQKKERDLRDLLNNAERWAEGDKGDWKYKEAVWIAMQRYMYGDSGIQHHIFNEYVGYTIDYHKAIKYGEIAISKGIHKFGLLNFYGFAFDSNNSLELMVAWCHFQLKEYGKAEYWYEKAYEQGEKWALFKVGEIYVDRTDGKNDYEKAIKYFEKSIKNDWFVADNEFMIARLHYEGKGFPEDKAKGLEMIRAAAKKGSEIAKEYMKKNDLTMGGMLDD